jgi:hypothetical protein
MSRRAGRLGGALSLLGLVALVLAGLATADSSPPAPIGSAKPVSKTGKVKLVGQSNPLAAPAGRVHAVAYRLVAKLAPSSATSTATGRWDGLLVHTTGNLQSGKLPSLPGCSVTPKPTAPPNMQAPRPTGAHRLNCIGPVPPFALPNGQHWLLGWRVTYSNLSSAVTGVDLRLTIPGAAAPQASTLCGPCATGKFGHTTLTDDQGMAILKGNGSVVIRTADNSAGEISGQIVRVQTLQTP